MNKLLNYLHQMAWPVLILITVIACQSHVEKPKESSLSKFEDSLTVEIYDLQDKRDSRGLMSYFNNENERYRKEAALAFGSVQDSAAIPMLALLLNDQSPKVRKAAAYALGQSYDSGAVKPIVRALSAEDSLFVRRELYEALGKVITQPQLPLLYQQPDNNPEEKEGMAWGLYRAGLRNVHDAAAVELAISYLNSANSYDTRLGAAHFLSRTRDLDLGAHENVLITSSTEDPSANVRMAAIMALRKVPSFPALKTLSHSALSDNDYRVRANSLRGLATFDFDAIKFFAFKALSDSNINVAIAAAELIDSKAIPDPEVLEQAEKQNHPRVKASLYGTALRLAVDKDEVIKKIRQEYEESEDPYFKAGLLSALGHSIKSHEFIITKTFSEEHPAITTAGIEALINLRTEEDFPPQLKPAFAEIFEQAMETGDIAMVATTAGLLSDPKLGFKEEYSSTGFLYQAKSRLSLPKDNEALQVLNRAIAYFEGKEKMPETKNEYNNPIDWKLIKSIEKDQVVRVNTEKGDFLMRLLVEDAPGSVANFVRLSQAGYFDNKNFHRVVPNFVVQGGCSRGDGYGGEDYSIRSELTNLRYQEGSVGMASAGKDTEGTQWFVTHSPTPHLDGRYTIFAQVTEGMDVVHQIEVGDKILSVELLK
ncbi:peptidyl-prolyl cis-trans isomerase B [Fulvivirga imtechensis AK7]|uniref:peptidylprolyl isomerase n=1 Tax=Fulvivirga imtechensis AK7 TaxID=1237149 RepID=L8JLV6_9BACT|nr:peptidylprolyl isomerase [Fulvivirga imtechensis]ELR69770.1 peptidyl-prolyl cis-trans isomerase B [Fulvivirga imtechensis AK7]